MSPRMLRLGVLGLAGLAIGSAASACPPYFFRPWCWRHAYYAPAPQPYFAPQPYYAPVPYSVAPTPTYPPPRVQVEPSRPQELAKPESAKPDPTAKPNPPAPTTQAPPAGVKPVEFRPAESTPLAPPRPALPETTVPGFKIDPPTGATPKPDVPQLPAPETPKPKELEGTKIPPIVPQLRGVPDPTVPPLAIPTPAVDPPKSSTSKASPLSDRRAEVVPVDGVLADPNAQRTVGFFNRSDRDVQLMVQGQTIALPKQHYVTARVPATFDWKLDDGPDERTTIPTAAPGVEVVIRR